MKKVFIGVDFSKEKFDAVLFEQPNQSTFYHQIFDNQQSGYTQFIQWIETHTTFTSRQWLICGEHTGLYSFSLTQYLNDKGIDIWLESALQIKRSMGLVRSKNDKTDAFHIAMYAYRFRDRAQSTRIRSQALDQIKDLCAYRKRLIGMRTALKISANELSRIKSNDAVDFIQQASHIQIQTINCQLKVISIKIKKLLSKDKELYDNYQLLGSIKGIGHENAVMALILTDNFKSFTDPRKFGCYCGVVPFEHSSGTSIKSKDRVSHLAHKDMKALLTEAARSAVRHDKNLKDYYTRKLQDGKDRFLVINNVRNKLIHTIFGVIKHRKPYDPDFYVKYRNPA